METLYTWNKPKSPEREAVRTFLAAAELHIATHPHCTTLRPSDLRLALSWMSGLIDMTPDELLRSAKPETTP